MGGVEKSGEMMREWAIDIWRVNRSHPYVTLSRCLEMKRVTQSLKSSCYRQSSINNYEVALRAIDMLIDRLLLVGDDELLKNKRTKENLSEPNLYPDLRQFQKM